MLAEAKKHFEENTYNLITQKNLFNFDIESSNKTLINNFCKWVYTNTDQKKNKFYILDNLTGRKENYISFLNKMTDYKIKFINFFAFEEIIFNQGSLDIFRENITEIKKYNNVQICFYIPITKNIVESYLYGKFLFNQIRDEFNIDKIYLVSPKEFNFLFKNDFLLPNKIDFLNFLNLIYNNETIEREQILNNREIQYFIYKKKEENYELDIQTNFTETLKDLEKEEKNMFFCHNHFKALME